MRPEPVCVCVCVYMYMKRHILSLLLPRGLSFYSEDGRRMLQNVDKPRPQCTSHTEGTILQATSHPLMRTVVRVLSKLEHNYHSVGQCPSSGHNS